MRAALVAIGLIGTAFCLLAMIYRDRTALDYAISFVFIMANIGIILAAMREK